MSCDNEGFGWNNQETCSHQWNPFVSVCAHLLCVDALIFCLFALVSFEWMHSSFEWMHSSFVCLHSSLLSVCTRLMCVFTHLSCVSLSPYLFLSSFFPPSFSLLQANNLLYHDFQDFPIMVIGDATPFKNVSI